MFHYIKRTFLSQVVEPTGISFPNLLRGLRFYMQFSLLGGRGLSRLRLHILASCIRHAFFRAFRDSIFCIALHQIVLILFRLIFFQIY